MSRIGRKPIALPAGVTVGIEGADVKVKGPKGQLQMTCPGEIRAAAEGNAIVITSPDAERKNKALHGLTRSLVSNMVIGVSQGFQRVLEIVGVGFRADAQGQKINFTLGYSHPVVFQVPDGVTAAVDKKQTTLTLAGIDKQLLGQVAANIRSLREPDAYKGKGIRYQGEVITLKAGKTGKK